MEIIEKWKDIPNYEGMYQASTKGRLRSLDRISASGKKLKSRILKTYKHDNYMRVILQKDRSRKTFLVHQLIAMAFLSHKPCGHKLVVNHINFNTEDNSVANLNIKTNRENTSYRKAKGASKYTGVFWQKQINKWFSIVSINGKRKYLGVFNKEYDAHLAYQSELTTDNLTSVLTGIGNTSNSEE